MSKTTPRSSLVAVLALFGCGARTEPIAVLDADVAADADARADAATEAEADVAFDAAGCPPVPVGWNESIVADHVTSYAAAADDRCGIVVVSVNASKQIDVAVVDELGVWHHSPLGVIGTPSAVAVARGAIHVAYYDGSSQRYVVQRAGAVSTPLEIEAASLEHAAMAVDAADVVHVAYESNFAGVRGLRYAELRDVGWNHANIDDRPAANPTMAAITWDGLVRIAYENVSDPADRRCVIASGAATHFASVDLPPADGHPSSHPCTLRVPTDTDRLLHLAYGADGPEGTLLRHAYGNVGALSAETIDRVATEGTDPGAAALDSLGAFRIAYRGAESGAPLKLAVLGAGTPAAIQTVTTDDAEDLRVVVDGAGATNMVALTAGRLFVSRGN